MAPAAAATAPAPEEKDRPRPKASSSNNDDDDAAAGKKKADADADADETSLPVIDLARYYDHGDPDNGIRPGAQAELARGLRAACESVGFFFLENHGVPRELVERAFAAARAFFALPGEEKARCRASAATKNRGWTPPEAETLDPARQRTRGDLKEGFYVGREIDADSRMAALPLHGPNVWPREAACPGFRDACEAYHAALTSLARRLLPAVAEAAGAPSSEAFVAAVFGEHGGGGGGDDGGGGGGGEDAPFSSGPMAFARLLSYLPEPSDAEAGVLGCGAHSDWGMLTFLAAEAPGLQVLRRRRRKRGEGEGGASAAEDGVDGQRGDPQDSSYWQDVPLRPGSFVVNVGDMLERWTGGRLRSTVHRVVVRGREAAGEGGEEAGGGRRRQSIAFFLDPSYSALIAPADGASGGGGERYAPVRAGAYLLQRYAETHAGFVAEEGG